jgi:hypothetical protein
LSYSSQSLLTENQISNNGHGRYAAQGDRRDLDGSLAFNGLPVEQPFLVRLLRAQNRRLGALLLGGCGSLLDREPAGGFSRGLRDAPASVYDV